MAQIEKKNYVLETFCFIFGIASAVMATVSFVGLVVNMTDCRYIYRPTNFSMFFLVSLIAVFIVGWFALCILLCVGICKRKADFMRIYCVFITLSEFVILPITAVLTFCFSDWLPGVTLALMCCVVHVLGVILVKKTIHKIQREQTKIEETMTENLIEKN